MNAVMETPGMANEEDASRRRIDALSGVLIGTAVGDALGLPLEGIGARRQHRLFSGPLRHRLIGRFGMLSDDTEHTFLLAQSLLESPDDPAAFQRSLARRLRWWLTGVPAGVGFATLRAILRLWAGVPPHRSGVRSAGNGAAMRSALLGVYFANDANQRRAFVRASTAITHRDVRAEIAALAVAETTAWMADATSDTGELLKSLEALGDNEEWRMALKSLRLGLSLDLPVSDFATRIGAADRVSGYAFQSVPLAIYAALRHRSDYSTALAEVIACGGDTDTTGAITGALIGARSGTFSIPAEWRAGIAEFPLSIRLLSQVAERLDHQLDTGVRAGPVRYGWPAIPFRNLAFLAVVLAHGLRRLLPPY